MRQKGVSVLVAVTALALCVSAMGQGSRGPSRSPTGQTQRTVRSFELQALTPEFWTIFDRHARLATFASGLGFTEGPVWDPSGFVWISDESENRIVKVYRDGHRETMLSLTDPDGSTYDGQHRLLSTASGLRSIIRLSADGKSFTTVVSRYDGKKLNTPNDIVIGPDRAIYFTDPIIDMTAVQRKDEELPPSVYRLGKTQKMTLLTDTIKAPNGLAFSPNGKYLYIDDDSQRDIMRYRFRNGKISHGIIFGDMTSQTEPGVPDGMKVDRKGHLFVSGPGGIWVWNKKGVHIGTVQMPRAMANLTWGGSNYSTLFIAASGKVYTLATKTRGVLGYLR